MRLVSHGVVLSHPKLTVAAGAGLRRTALPATLPLMADSAYPRLAGTLLPVFACDTRTILASATPRPRASHHFLFDLKLGLLQVLPINETVRQQPLQCDQFRGARSGLPDAYAGTGARFAAGDAGHHVSRRGPRQIATRPVQYREVKQLKLEILSHAYVEFEASIWKRDRPGLRIPGVCRGQHGLAARLHALSHAP